MLFLTLNFVYFNVRVPGCRSFFFCFGNIIVLDRLRFLTKIGDVYDVYEGNALSIYFNPHQCLIVLI